VKVLEVLNRLHRWQLDGLPSPGSIAGWVQKSGYHLYQERGSVAFSEGYAVIVDESMMVGSEKLLLTLGVPAVKRGMRSLTEGDVQVLDMSVRSSWNSASIGAVFAGVEARMASPPAYVISDNASTIGKAVRDRGYTHMRDVGHSVGLFIQQVYEKEGDFQALMKQVSGVKFREVMRSTAYLLPPKQRTIARFMNLSGTVSWATSMLKIFGLLSEEERAVFRFLRQHRLLIKELQLVFRTVNPMLQRLKSQGLSLATARGSLFALKPLLTSPAKRVSAVGRLIASYIKEEVNLLPAHQEARHISSDVIETLFGSYKARKSPNAMNGVTKQVFILPLLTQLKKEPKDAGCFKNYLEAVRLADLDAWRNKHLSENRTVKRRKLLHA
jgi:hypothetical protein